MSSTQSRHSYFNQPTNQPTNQSINQPTNQSTNQPTNQPINQPTNQPREERECDSSYSSTTTSSTSSAVERRAAVEARTPKLLIRCTLVSRCTLSSAASSLMASVLFQRAWSLSGKCRDSVHRFVLSKRLQWSQRIHPLCCLLIEMFLRWCLSLFSSLFSMNNNAAAAATAAAYGADVQSHPRLPSSSL